jgi:hypothetical protein
MVRRHGVSARSEDIAVRNDILSVCNREHAALRAPPLLAQWGPLVIQSFSLNLADEALAYRETKDDETPRLGHFHPVILGVHQG